MGQLINHSSAMCDFIKTQLLKAILTTCKPLKGFTLAKLLLGFDSVLMTWGQTSINSWGDYSDNGQRRQLVDLSRQ